MKTKDLRKVCALQRENLALLAKQAELNATVEILEAKNVELQEELGRLKKLIHPRITAS